MAPAPPDDARFAVEPEGAGEHDLLLHLRLSNRGMGTAADRAEIELLAGALEVAIEEAGVGEYDGDEFGGGQCTLFFAGPDADRLLAVLQPVLHRHQLGRGATVTVQRGQDADPEQRQL